MPVVGGEGSTRAIALVRIGLPLVVLSEWADGLVFIREQNPRFLLLSASTFAASIAVLAGVQTRLATFWLALTVTGLLAWLGYARGKETYLHHHSHAILLACWLLALTPCGASYSVDRWLTVRAARQIGKPPEPERGPLWGQRLLCLLVSTIYVWSAIDKLSPAFLSGARLEQIYLHYYATALPESAIFHVAFVLLAWTTIALELFLAVGLWLPATRRYALAAGMSFHIGLYVLLPVSTFSALMILLYLTFLDPDSAHRLIDDLGDPAKGAAT